MALGSVLWERSVEAFSTIDDPRLIPVIALTKEVGRGESADR
jgi:hypothetical protein